MRWAISKSRVTNQSSDAADYPAAVQPCPPPDSDRSDSDKVCPAEEQLRLPDSDWLDSDKVRPAEEHLQLPDSDWLDSDKVRPAEEQLQDLYSLLCGETWRERKRLSEGG